MSDQLRKLIKLEALFGVDFIPSSGVARFTSEAKGATSEFETFRQQVLKCTKCKLSAGRTQVVFGVGNLQSPIMFVGEGPGEEEDLRGEPFVGRAGRLLTATLEKLGVKRQQVYIANIVKCRPPGNRTPEFDEVTACMPYLLKQIAYIKPKVICALGAVAVKALMNRTNASVLSMRGKYYSFNNLKIFVTVHPSYCLRNPRDTVLLETDLRTVLLDVGLTK